MVHVDQKKYVRLGACGNIVQMLMDHRGRTVKHKADRGVLFRKLIKFWRWVLFIETTADLRLINNNNTVAMYTRKMLYWK